jgi:predicted Zn-dependent peptidase
MPIAMTTLPSGLRIVTDKVESMESVALGIWAAVGTRHENLLENGVAHMVEHMMFKGTPTMSAQKIAEVIEDVGGHMNAYTGREMTAYYTHLLKEDTDLALDVLADMIQNSTMPEDEVERERGVILQEIKMYEDDPDQLVHDHFQEAAYPDQALGASGLGTSSIISGMKRKTLMDYTSHHYTAQNLVVSAAGPIDHGTFVEKVTSRFDHLPQGTSKPYVPAHYNPQPSLCERPTEQVHLILGFKGVARKNSRYPAIRLLSALLGGGASSRLYQEVREKRGLVYSIQSFQDSFHDDGLFGIYAGTGPDLLPQMIPVILGELKSVMDNVTTVELTRAKTQIKAGVLMAREKMMTRADQQARHVINFGKPFSVEDMVAKINAVTPEDIFLLAQDVFTSQPVLAGIGPLKNLICYDDLCKKLAA